jgi:hypothetical protein
MPRWTFQPFVCLPGCTPKVFIACVLGMLHRLNVPGTPPCACLCPHTLAPADPVQTHQQVANLQLKLHQLHATDVNTFRWDCSHRPCPNARRRVTSWTNRVCLQQRASSRLMLGRVLLHRHAVTCAGAAMQPSHSMWRHSSWKQV